MARPKKDDIKEKLLNIRVTPEEKIAFYRKANERGFRYFSDMVFHDYLGKKDVVKIAPPEQAETIKLLDLCSQIVSDIRDAEALLKPEQREVWERIQSAIRGMFIVYEKIRRGLDGIKG